MAQGTLDVTTGLQKRTNPSKIDRLLMVNPETEEPQYIEMDQVTGQVRGDMLPAFDLDNIRVMNTTAPDNKVVKSNVLDPITKQYTTFREVTSGIIDGVSIVQSGDKLYQRVGGLSAEMFGAVPDLEIDNTTALQNYIDACCRLKQMNVSIDKDYYINSLLINSAHSGINLHGKGTLMMLNGPVRRAAIRIYDENHDIENITIDIKVKGFSRYTLDAEGDRPYNQSIGQDHNGIVATAHPNGRIKNIFIRCQGESLEGTLIHFNAVENGEAHAVGKHIGTHCFGANISNFGANNSWPSDFNPNIKFRVDGVDCNTAFDLSTTGVDKDDIGPNTPTAEILGVVMRNQRSNTKVHGYWGVTQSGTIDIKNDFRVQALVELPAYRIFNTSIAYYKGTTIKIEGFWRAFENYSQTGEVSIDNIVVTNCMYSFYLMGRTDIKTLTVNNVYCVAELAINASLFVSNFYVNKVRKQKWITELASIKDQGYWLDRELPPFPMRFISNGGKFVVNNQFYISDIGEDSIDNPVITDFFKITRDNTEVDIKKIVTSGAAVNKVVNLINVDLDGSSWVSKVNVGGYSESQDVTSGTILKRSRGVLISELRDVIPLSKLNGDIFNFTLSKIRNRFEWIDNQGNRRSKITVPATITDGDLEKATSNQIWDGLDDKLFITSLGLKSRLVREKIEYNSTNINFSSADDRRLVYFTAATAGNASLISGRFQEDDVLVGFNEGAAKTITSDGVVTLHGSNLIVGTGQYFEIHFKSATVAWVKVFSAKAAASANTATVASGATPTKSEFDALLNELRDLKTKMRNAGLLAS